MKCRALGFGIGLLVATVSLFAQKASELKYVNVEEFAVLLNQGFDNTEMRYSRLPADCKDEIRKAVLSQVDRGVTMLHGAGGYHGRDTEVLLSVVSNYELPRVQQLARSIDPDCFMIISHVTEVWGRGFTYGKKAEPQEKA